MTKLRIWAKMALNFVSLAIMYCGKGVEAKEAQKTGAAATTPRHIPSDAREDSILLRVHARIDFMGMDGLRGAHKSLSFKFLARRLASVVPAFIYMYAVLVAHFTYAPLAAICGGRPLPFPCLLIIAHPIVLVWRLGPIAETHRKAFLVFPDRPSRPTLPHPLFSVVC